LLLVVDLSTEKISKVNVGKGPAQVYVESDGKYAFVANQGTESIPSHTLTKVNLKTLKAEATIKTGKGSHGVVASPDNKTVYVTNMFEDTVSVIDNKSNKIIRTIPVGKTPNGISIMPK
jgi:YVTN family beta-propeller protein